MGLPSCDLLECLGVCVVPVLSHLEKPPGLWDGLCEGVKMGLGCVAEHRGVPLLTVAGEWAPRGS